MKYLVTGSRGFIGTHLVRALEAHGHSVAGLDLKDGSGDIRNLEDILSRADGTDGIFHLAAVASVQESIKNPKSTFQTNVTGTRNILEAAKKLGGIPVVYASSAAVYGDNQNLPLRETEAPSPLSPYAEHKMHNEEDAKSSGLPTFGLRFFNVYGPGQDPSSPYSGVISIFYQRLLAGQKLAIYGDGLQTRDFVAVKDVAETLLKAMKHSSTQSPVANVCTGTQTTLLQLADLIAASIGRSADFEMHANRSGDIRHSCGCPLYLKSLGFEAQTSLAEGLLYLKTDD